MASSADELFKKFLSEMRGSNDERLYKFHSIIERDRFGVERFDGDIQSQLERGDYGEFGRHIWQSFKEQNTQSPPEA